MKRFFTFLILGVCSFNYSYSQSPNRDITIPVSTFREYELHPDRSPDYPSFRYFIKSPLNKNTIRGGKGVSLFN